MNHIDEIFLNFPIPKKEKDDPFFLYITKEK